MNLSGHPLLYITGERGRKSSIPVPETLLVPEQELVVIDNSDPHNLCANIPKTHVLVMSAKRRAPSGSGGDGRRGAPGGKRRVRFQKMDESEGDYWYRNMERVPFRVASITSTFLSA